MKNSKSDIIGKFASDIHEEWRKTFDPTGTKSRIKKNSDGSEANINVIFSELHPDWQKENIEAGKAAYEALIKYPTDEEAAAEYIHNEWIKRNPKEDWNVMQHVTYHSLSEKEKDKDRIHVRNMRKLITSN